MSVLDIVEGRKQKGLWRFCTTTFFEQAKLYMDDYSMTMIGFVVQLVQSKEKELVFCFLLLSLACLFLETNVYIMCAL